MRNIRNYLRNLTVNHRDVNHRDGYLFRMVVAFSAIKNLTLWCYPRIINK